jgi:hypothetical protein
VIGWRGGVAASIINSSASRDGSDSAWMLSAPPGLTRPIATAIACGIFW